MKKIELLSPAGNMEALKAAIMAGCDSVYLGGTLFSARAFAGNFTNEELIKAIEYAHLFGVKVYVTCNILILEREVDRFIDYIDFLHQNNVDAILIQDLGMLDLVHKKFPNLEIHASTQMHIHNLDSAIMAKKLGCKRVVLARETPIEVIENIKEVTGLDVEIFAHGSLCVSYSGQCLFSSIIGNRSGNRGSCTACCRLPYNIVDSNNNILNKGNYPLSMKDLNTLEYVGDLIDFGVDSLKIEGRMKSFEYVYVVTKLYREAIDSYYKYHKVIINNDLMNKLKRIFNRDFTKGYLFHENIKNIINPIFPNHKGVKIGKVIDYKNNFVYIKLFDKINIHDGIRITSKNFEYGLELNEFYINKKLVKNAKNLDVVSFKVNKNIPINSDVLLTKDSSLIEEIDNIIKDNPRKVLIDAKIIIKEDNPIKLIVSDGINEVEEVESIPSKAINNPITKEVIINKLNRLGDTIYKFSNIDIILDDNLFVSIKEINDLRRRVIDKLNSKRLYKTDYKKSNYSINVKDFPKEEKSSVLVNKINNNLNYDLIYSENKNDNAIIKLSNVMDNYDNLDINREYLVGEIGAFNKLKNINTDYSLNVVNSYTVALLHSLGAKRITLSLELKPNMVKDIIDSYHNRYLKHPNLEVIIEGRRKLMTLKTDLTKIYQDNISLVDRFKNKYLIRRVNDLCYIYDYRNYQDDFDYYSIGVNYLRKNKEV